MRVIVLLASLAVLGSQSRAELIYVGTNSGIFGTYDTIANTFNTIATGSTVLYGLGFNGGTLYANDNNAPSSLYTVSPSNGSLSPIGPFSDSGNGTGTLASAPGGGTLYFADHQDLFTVDPSGGALTEVGPLGFSVAGGFDLNYGPDGNLYDSSANNLYEINTATGAGTLVGSFGNGLQMQMIVEADGNLYGFDTNQMYKINLGTGAATFVQDTNASLGNFDSATQIPAAATPEPGSIALLAVGLAIGATRMKRRLNR